MAKATVTITAEAAQTILQHLKLMADLPEALGMVMEDLEYELDEVERQEKAKQEGIEIDGVLYTHPDHVQFILDMADEFDIHNYRGRFFYKGPSVHVSN